MASVSHRQCGRTLCCVPPAHDGRALSLDVLRHRHVEALDIGEKEVAAEWVGVARRRAVGVHELSADGEGKERHGESESEETAGCLR